MPTLERSVRSSSNTDSDFRAWVQFIFDAFATAGWTQTADTGQIDPTTATHPGTTHTKGGYAIWAMTDALAAEFPVMVKLWFGTGPLALGPAIWFEVGNGSDGAGNLADPDDHNHPAALFSQIGTVAPLPGLYDSTGPLYDSGLDAVDKQIPGWPGRPCRASGAGGRIVLAMFDSVPNYTRSTPTIEGYHSSGCVSDPNLFCPPAYDECGGWHLGADGVVNQFGLLFAIERGKDADGNDVGENVIVQWTGTDGNSNQAAAGALCRAIYLPTQHKGGAPLTAMRGVSYVLPNAHPATGSTFDGVTPAIAVGLPVYEHGAAPRPHGTNLLVSPVGKIAYEPPLNDETYCPPGDWPDNIEYEHAHAIPAHIFTTAIAPYGVTRTYIPWHCGRTASADQGHRDPNGRVYMLWE